MRSYTIKKTVGDVDWSAVETLAIDNKYYDTPAEMKAFAQIAYDDESIKIHLWSENDDIRAVEKGPIGSPCEDSCLEFFFCPMEGDERYFNIEFNSNLCMYLGFGRCLTDHVRLLPQEGAEVFAPKVNLTETGWEIFYTVSFEFIRRFCPEFEVKKGRAMRANCYKCADLTTPSNYLSWNLVEGEPFTYHKPSCFGVMYFD